jgi:hypothetical protein
MSCLFERIRVLEYDCMKQWFKIENVDQRGLFILNIKL